MIIEGVLEKVSGGGYLNTYTIREFIVVDGKRIQKVHLTNFMDELLSECLGHHVRLSVIKGRGGYIVLAINIRNSETHKIPVGQVIMQTIVEIVVALLLILLTVMLIWFLSFGFLSLVLGFLVAFFLICYPVYNLFRILKGRSALDLSA